MRFFRWLKQLFNRPDEEYDPMMEIVANMALRTGKPVVGEFDGETFTAEVLDDPAAQPGEE